MNSFLTTMLSIILMIFLGYFLKKIKLLKSDDVSTLNKIVINIAMPCMVFNALINADMSLLPKLSIMPFIGLITSLIIGLLSYGFFKFKRYSKEKIWTIIIIVTMGNTAFLGFPINFGIYGSYGLIVAIFYDVASIIIFLALSFILILVFGGTFSKAVKKILTFPPLWALILGIFFNIFHIQIGNLGLNIVNYLSGAAIPLIMISLGLSLNLNGFKWNSKIISICSLIKLVIYPIIALSVVILLHVKGIEANIAIIEASMPSGMLALVLAVNHDLDFRLASDSIFSNTIFSFITLSFIIGLL